MAEGAASAGTCVAARALGLAAGLLATGWANPAAAAPPELLTAAEARHLLERAAYGPAPGDLARLQAQGATAWIAQQLAPEGLEEPARLRERLAALGTLTLSPLARARQYRAPLQAAKRQKAQDRSALAAARRVERQLLREAQAARVWRALASPRQLQEVMVEFWADHFNVHARKRAVGAMLGDMEERVLRPQAFGRFRDLLGAVARHPAMLDYLDNWRNSRPNPQNRRFSGVNENYARELLELHTLGVHGGYDQGDVVALTAILTGWGFPRGWPEPRGAQSASRGALDEGFYFDARRHLPGSKRLLGVTIPEGGQAEGEQALDLLARHPATARFLARKLACRFVADDPPAALIDATAAAFQASDGRLDATLRCLLSHPDFWAPQARQARFKTPYRLVISTLRASGQFPDSVDPALQAMARLGQPLHGCATPDGWPVARTAWLNPEAMARRVSFAAQAARQATVRPDELAETLGSPFGERSRLAIAAAPPALRLALMLGAPEFQEH
ncbi:MAG: DUF1800 domain-containing protein [Candidatus Sericytochromatia bacterium]|nr:DUF1800 domain-containing protein [Candidatus Sericytochromatia bacterium]